jgi:hypothetical protein
LRALVTHHHDHVKVDKDYNATDAQSGFGGH